MFSFMKMYRKTFVLAGVGALVAGFGVSSARATIEELQAPVGYGSAGGPVFVTAALLNSDNHLDLVTVNKTGNTVGVLINKGNGTFNEAVTYSTGGTAPTSAVAADFNGNGTLDLVVANSGGTTVGFLAGNGDGTFGAAAQVEVGGNPGWIAGGDLNKDNRADFVVTRTDTREIAVYLSEGNGGFTLKTTAPTGVNPRQLNVNDLTGDQNLDVVGTNADGQIGVYQGAGDGTFSRTAVFRLSTSINIDKLEGIVAANFNNKGSNDIAITRLAPPGSGFFGIPNLGVAHDYNPETERPTVDLFKQKNAGNEPESVAVGDISGDNILDLVVANRASNDVSILTGIGDGFFNNPVHKAGMGGGLNSVVVGDFDGNGKIDFAAAESANNRVNVFLNGQAPTTPTCNFTPYTDVPFGHIFYESIKCLSCKNIVSGTDGRFDPGAAATWAQAADWVSKATNTTVNPGPTPNAPITRGELARMISDAAGWTDTVSASFADVPAGHAQFNEIGRLQTHTGTRGFPCGASTEPCANGESTRYFRPDAAATRGQVAQFLQLAFFKECGAAETVSETVAAGTNIKVSIPPLGLTLNVTEGGQITVSTLDINLYLPWIGAQTISFPVGYTVSSESLAFELTSSAQLGGDQEVCIDLTNLPQLKQLHKAQRLKILHGETNGQNLSFVDRTTEGVDPNTICARVTSFSPFILAVAPGRSPGDVNGDGSVNVADAVEVLRSAVDLGQLDTDQTFAADVDSSGQVDVADAVKILRVTVDLDPEFGGP